MNLFQTSFKICTFLTFLFISEKTQSQCIEYQKIEGSVCQSCEPTGWTATMGTPDIIDPLSYQAICVNTTPSTSPSGGNASQFVVSNSDVEAMQTTITALTPGQEYYLAFWYASVDCVSGICCAGLEIRVDDNVTSFSTVADWTLAELCVVANSTSMDIELIGTSSPNFGGFLLVDDAECDLNFEPSFDPIFNFEDTLCRNTGIVELDSFTIDSILGQWTLPRFNTDTITAETIHSTWTPISTDFLCNTEKQISLHINNPVTPIFDIPLILCESDNAFNLPGISNNSISGTWTVIAVDPSGLGGTSISTTFIPDDNNCTTAVTFEINVIEEQIPEFDPQEKLCKSDILSLPNLSNNNILGTWTINPIDASAISTSAITTTFQPNETCFAEYELTIQIENINEPIFDLPTYLCPADSIYFYPTVSDNNISGTWDFSQFNPSDNIGQDIVSTFFPNDSFCSVEFISSITIPPNIDWSVNSNAPTSCNNTDGQIIFTSPLQGLEFSIDSINWQTNDFDDLSPGVYVVYTRVPEFSSCVESMIVSLPAIDLPEITNIEITAVSSCSMSNGELLVTANGNNLEYSLDNLVWQDSNLFENLPADLYRLYVRSQEFNDCIIDSFATITAPSLVQILAVIPTDLTSCVIDNGEIEIIAEGNDLEFTIDGINWQASNIFQNLGSGAFTVGVRNQNQTDCFDNKEVTVLSAPIVQIDNISGINNSTCSPSSGGISIVATGENLEYSIDGGVNFSTVNSFDNLEAGSYNVIVRNNLIQDCIDTDIITLIFIDEELPQPVINIEPQSDCRTNDAKLTVELSFQNLEYSLSSDNLWQSSNIFENLGSGFYTLFVRDSLNIDCKTSLDFEIETVDCPCMDLEIEVNVVPSGCDEVSSGTIFIEQITGQEFGIDSLIWENECCGFSLSELSPDWYFYTVYYDSTCVWNDSILVEALDPLTFGLNTFDPDCQGDNDGIIEVIDVMSEGELLSYSIDGSVFQDSSIFFNLSPQAYTVFVQEQIDCIESQNTFINDGAFLTHALSDSETVQLGDSLFLNPLINEATIDSFSWSPSSSVLNPGQLIALVKPSTTTQYELTVYFGECQELLTIIVEVETSSDDLYLANVFTPMAEDNNYFFAQGKSDSELELINFSIYDRWGNNLFNKDDPIINNPLDGWDGLYLSLIHI